MKKMFVLAAALSSVLVVNHALAAKEFSLDATQKNTLNATDASKPVIADHDGKLTIIVKANPTTGYSWHFDASKNTAGIKVLHHHYYSPKTNVMGASGYEKWTLELPKSMRKAPTQAKISMVYGRPWDATTNTVKTFTVRSHKKHTAHDKPA
jgi:predicted secreted protein